ncbi:NADP oxidoreductase [Streptomyces phaeolivaceus]|uniref:NADP oxidoreductase n=1 Tax=Streptomyces phaeolivaceus TaxID=2653200 RepID=A0A5P8KGB8_9ACTN|nr:NAD(P)-binding domain-containing protein [Streptomyces phaeolivaceus]QFR01580.1 NADP oxidoreductase [Streptomyces phaeolivaceus]
MIQPPTLGIIGCGRAGSALARLAVAADLNVVVSNSRDPGSLAALVAELGAHARAATSCQAARFGDMVALAVPLNAYDRLPAPELRGKTVVDLMNYYPERHGRIAELDSGEEATSSRLVQNHLVDSRVVRVFSDIDFRLLQPDPRRGPADRSTLPIAGDDAEAKAEVTRLLGLLGYHALDVGTFESSRALAALAIATEQARAVTRVMAERLDVIAPGAPGYVNWPAASWSASTRICLAPQEQRIMALAAAGRSVTEMAREMYLSEKTVRNYLSRIYRKLGVRTRTEAVLRWLGRTDSPTAVAPARMCG